MAESRSLAIQQPVAAELYARLDNPAEGAVVVIRDVGDEEGVVGVERGAGCEALGGDGEVDHG
jgi:hypothetical protein